MASGSEIHDPRLRGSQSEAVEKLAPTSNAEEILDFPRPECDYSNDDIGGMNEKVKNSLLQQGYTVREGNFHIYYDFAAFASNPGARYWVYDLLESESVNPIFSLEKPSSAVLYLGCTPSSTKYFSFRSYAFKSKRELVFASLGDSINNLVINTTQSGASWTQEEAPDPAGKLTAIVTTADGQTFSTLTTALDEAGVPSGIVNLDAIPSSKVDLFNDRSLNFVMLHRANVWEDQDQKNAYSFQIRRVLFIDPPSDQEFDPLPDIPLRSQWSGNPEAEQPGVEQGLATLHDSILAFMESSSYTLVSNVTLKDYHLDGFECLEEGIYCLGDNRDATYLEVRNKRSFKKEEVYVLVGTNAVATGKSVYTSMGIYQLEYDRKSDGTDIDTARLVSTNIAADSRDMEHSASAFGVDDDKLMAYTMSRNCKELPAPLREYCLTVGYDEIDGLPQKMSWSLWYRTYLNPETKTAPLPSELVMPRVLKFQVV